MKKTIVMLSVLVSIIYIQAFSQSGFGEPKDSTNFEIKINPDFFLLGTFSDYMGRFQYINRETQLDRYYPYEEPLANYVTKFINQHYDIKVNTKFATSRHSEIFSVILAEKLNNVYFDKKGIFKEEQLDTEEKKYSFLLGVYYRYGEKLEGNIYKIQVANSSKDKQIYQILKDLECDKLVYKFLRGYIPSSDIFYFEATPRMIKYFNTINKEKQELQQSFYDKLLKKSLEDKGGVHNGKQTELIKSLKLIFN